MIRFQMARHTAKEGEVVEIWDDDRFVGAVYPNDKDTGVTVMSKYLKSSNQVSRRYGETSGEVRITGLKDPRAYRPGGA